MLLCLLPFVSPEKKLFSKQTFQAECGSSVECVPVLKGSAGCVYLESPGLSQAVVITAGSSPGRGDVLWSECGCTLSLLSGLYLFSVLEVSNQDNGPQHLTGTG